MKLLEIGQNGSVLEVEPGTKIKHNTRLSSDFFTDRFYHHFFDTNNTVVRILLDTDIDVDVYDRFYDLGIHVSTLPQGQRRKKSMGEYRHLEQLLKDHAITVLTGKVREERDVDLQELQSSADITEGMYGEDRKHLDEIVRALHQEPLPRFAAVTSGPQLSVRVQEYKEAVDKIVIPLANKMPNIQSSARIPFIKLVKYGWLSGDHPHADYFADRKSMMHLKRDIAPLDNASARYYLEAIRTEMNRSDGDPQRDFPLFLEYIRDRGVRNADFNAEQLTYFCKVLKDAQDASLPHSRARIAHYGARLLGLFGEKKGKSMTTVAIDMLKDGKHPHTVFDDFLDQRMKEQIDLQRYL